MRPDGGRGARAHASSGSHEIGFQHSPGKVSSVPQGQRMSGLYGTTELRGAGGGRKTDSMLLPMACAGTGAAGARGQPLPCGTGGLRTSNQPFPPESCDVGGSSGENAASSILNG
mmetsp:Transcript_69063/g.160066  ORF Transcript_69063/g.160066 Transcript_69063/m.160066 type:complete len:115 (-) Transcript_69063:73-417(-)